MIKVGIIGCGFMGEMHANCYRFIKDVKVFGVYDVSEERAMKLAALTGAKVYNNADALINDKEVDAINICVPTYLHKEYVIKCAKAKKHIFCEKPLAFSTEDVEEIIKELEKTKVKLMVGMVLHFWPEYAEFKKIVHSKKYGRLATLTCTRLSSHPVFGWDKWYSDPKRSGSAVLDLHIHDVDFIYYLLGKPKSVYSRGRKTKRGWEHVYTIYEYDGAVADAEAGWDMAESFGFVMAIRGTFEDGTVVEYNSKNQPLIIYSKEKTELVEIQEQEEVEESVETSGNISQLGGYYNEIKYWVECLKNDKHPEKGVSVREAKVVLEIIHSEVKSLETGERVILPS
jgi:predicted dehydrogenase